METLRYLQYVFVRPEYSIQIALGTGAILSRERPYITVTTEGKHFLEEGSFEAVTVEIERWSMRLSGRIIFVFSRTPDGALSHRRDDKRIVLATGARGAGILCIDPFRIVSSYPGNRIAVNGLRMSLRKLLRVFGPAKARLPAIFDINVLGDPDVVYDVSRDRIVGPGAGIVRKALCEAIFAALTELGVLERMTKETRNLTTSVLLQSLHDDFRLRAPQPKVFDEDLLDQVARRLPTTPWPKGIHVRIADELEISHGLCNRMISQMIGSGRIRKPDRPANDAVTAE